MKGKVERIDRLGLAISVSEPRCVHRIDRRIGDIPRAFVHAGVRVRQVLVVAPGFHGTRPYGLLASIGRARRTGSAARSAAAIILPCPKAARPLSHPSRSFLLHLIASATYRPSLIRVSAHRLSMVGTGT